MNSKQNQKTTTQAKNKAKQANYLETLREPSNPSSALKGDSLSESRQDLMRQMFGLQLPQNRSGEIEAGASLEMNEVLSGTHEANSKLRKQVAFERKLRAEEKELMDRKSNELRVELKAIIEEVTSLSQSTQELSQEVKIASMQAPVEPGVYHVIYFQKLLSFLRSYRQKVEEASTWLHSTNKRAQKKNYWAKYKKHGSKFLLSGEHYLTRSAG